jgi:hypothetical protein
MAGILDTQRLQSPGPSDILSHYCCPDGFGLIAANWKNEDPKYGGAVHLGYRGHSRYCFFPTAALKNPLIECLVERTSALCFLTLSRLDEALSLEHRPDYCWDALLIGFAD